MSGLDLGDIALAAAAGLLLGYAGALLSGFYPLGAAADPLHGRPGKALVLAATAAAALLGIGLLGFVFLATAWAPALIAAGLALLAGPLLFQALPPRATAGPAGLGACLLVTAALAALLMRRLFV